MSAHAMPANPGKRQLTLRRAVDDGFTYLALTVVSLIFLLPCLWLILASLSKSGSLYEIHGFFPTEYSLQTFIDLFTDDVNGLYPYRQWFLNTLYVASMSCVFGTVLVILTGYVMSRFRFKGRNAIKNLTLVLGMFPGFMGMTAIYIIMAQLGLLNRLEALIFLYAGTAPMGYLVQKGYFDTIPATIHEAVGLAAAPSGGSASPAAPQEPKAGKQSYLEHKEEQKKLRKARKAVEECERKIARLEARVKELDQLFLDPAKASDMGLVTEYADTRRQLDELQDEWLVLAEAAGE